MRPLPMMHWDMAPTPSPWIPGMGSTPTLFPNPMILTSGGHQVLDTCSNLFS